MGNLNLNASFQFITDTIWNILHVLERSAEFPPPDYEYPAKLRSH